MAAVLVRSEGRVSSDPIDKLLAASGDLGRIAGELEHVQQAFPRRVNADPERVEKGLAQLVLTLVELLRQLMERQALRRMENGTLTDEQIERMGETFMKLEARMEELKAHFELEDRDLNLNLGPLGNLLSAHDNPPPGDRGRSPRKKGDQPMASLKDVEQVADDLTKLADELRKEIQNNASFEKLIQIADQISEHADEAAGTFSTVNEALMSRLSELKDTAPSGP